MAVIYLQSERACFDTVKSLERIVNPFLEPQYIIHREK